MRSNVRAAEPLVLARPRQIVRMNQSVSPRPRGGDSQSMFVRQPTGEVGQSGSSDSPTVIDSSTSPLMLPSTNRRVPSANSIPTSFARCRQTARTTLP